MEDNDDIEWSEERAVKKLCVELFVRSLFYVAIVIAMLIFLEHFQFRTYYSFNGSDYPVYRKPTYRFASGLFALVMIFSLPLYVKGLMNRTGCEVRQLMLGIVLAVLVSTAVLCASVALFGLDERYLLMVGALGAGVIAGSAVRYKYGDDD